MKGFRLFLTIALVAVFGLLAFAPDADADCRNRVSFRSSHHGNAVVLVQAVPTYGFAQAGFPVAVAAPVHSGCNSFQSFGVHSGYGGGFPVSAPTFQTFAVAPVTVEFDIRDVRRSCGLFGRLCR